MLPAKRYTLTTVIAGSCIGSRAEWGRVEPGGSSLFVYHPQHQEALTVFWAVPSQRCQPGSGTPNASMLQARNPVKGEVRPISGAPPPPIGQNLLPTSNLKRDPLTQVAEGARFGAITAAALFYDVTSTLN